MDFVPNSGSRVSAFLAAATGDRSRSGARDVPAGSDCGCSGGIGSTLAPSCLPGRCDRGPVALRENCKRLLATILIVTASCALTYPVGPCTNAKLDPNRIHRAERHAVSVGVGIAGSLRLWSRVFTHCPKQVINPLFTLVMKIKLLAHIVKKTWLVTDVQTFHGC